MIISYPRLGRNGRLGNQIFEIASTIGIARLNGMEPVFPAWGYEAYFNKQLPHGYMQTEWVEENDFTYHDLRISESCNLLGYFQSYKYWHHCEREIFEQFDFNLSLIKKLKSEFINVFQKEVIAIHVRRTDYVDNENYYELPILYYTGALAKYFPYWPDKYNILIFSDDIKWCKERIKGSNIYFSEGRTDIEDLCLLSQCQNFILSNSTFCWWGAYLSQTNGIVVRPFQYFTGKIVQTHDTKDFWIPSWIPFDYTKEISYVGETI